MAMELGEAGADSDADPALEDLHWAYRSGNLIFFVGGGLSVAAGLPSRADLVAQLIEQARARGAAEARLAEMVELADKQRFIDALSVARECLGPGELGDAVERALDDQGIDKLPDLAFALGALRQGIRGVITTNLDHLLERAMGGAWPALARVTADIAQRRRFILKLHGTLSDRSTWVLTRDDVDQAMREGERRRQALAALFNESALLFLGYSLADDDFDAVLARLRSLSVSEPPRHFALVAADTVTPYRRGKLERSGVQMIAYDNESGDHRGVVRILRLLARARGGASEDHISLNPAPISGEVVRRAGDAPFPGLASFEREDARFFFGREAEIVEVTRRLSDTSEGQRRWLSIEGPRGAGKSSFAKAGVVPAVVEKSWVVGAPDVWRVAVLRPGPEPVLTLAHAVHGALKDRLPAETRSPSATAEAFRASDGALAALLREHTPKGTGLLLVVDQLEEVLTLAAPEPRAQLDALLSRALADPAGPLYLITTIESGALSRLGELPALSALLNAEAIRHDLGEMRRPALRAAIEGPAKLAGLSWERDLAARILEDALAAKAELPRIANVLHALWVRRHDNTLGQAAYDALGGVASGLPRLADALLDGLGKDGRDRAHRLLLGLLKITPEGALRQAVTRGDAIRAAGSGEKAERVLARLLGERDPKKPEGAEAPVRLLATVRGREGEEHRVELIHEALIEQWGTLKKWVDESRRQQDGEEARALAAAARLSQERAARAPRIIAALSVLAALLVALSALALRQRAEAARGRDAAVKERDEANHEREVAERHAEEARRTLDAERRMAPENAEIRRELAGAYNKLGDLAQAHGDVVAAREFFEKGLGLRDALCAVDPENADLQIDLALSRGRVASAAREAKDLPAFERQRDAAKAILDKLEREGQVRDNVKFAQAREWISRMEN